MAVMNPLGSRNIIIIDDNYIGEYSQAYMEVGKQIDDIIIKYIGILKGIIDDGSMKGLTAEKLYSFADTASMLLFKTAVRQQEFCAITIKAICKNLYRILMRQTEKFTKENML